MADYVQIYSLVNAVNNQALGTNDQAVIDSASFIDYGTGILSSSTNTEQFLSALMLVLARTYDTYRPYEASLRDLMVSGDEWGQIYRKIDAEVPDFVDDETYKLEDGQSVDQWVVRKPTAKQKLFWKKSVYSNYVTISRELLKGAFRSEGEFAAFVRMVFGKMRTKKDFSAENLARLAIGNYAGSLIQQNKTAQIHHLITLYNDASGKALATQAEAHLDPDYMAFASGYIQLQSDRMSHLSTLYNAEGAERHTPLKDQKLLVFDEFANSMRYTLEYKAFHDEMVRLRNYISVPYWQSADARGKINLKVDESHTVEQDNIVAFLFDRFALGTFRNNEETHTTPLNARARYYNTFDFADQIWYNDLSENAVLFVED